MFCCVKRGQITVHTSQLFKLTCNSEAEHRVHVARSPIINLQEWQGISSRPVEMEKDEKACLTHTHTRTRSHTHTQTHAHATSKRMWVTHISAEVQTLNAHQQTVGSSSFGFRYQIKPCPGQLFPNK